MVETSSVLASAEDRVHLYLPEEWRVTEARYSDEFVDRTETVFSPGNGFVGIRGSFEERYLVEEGEPLNVLIWAESHLLSLDNPVAFKRSPR